MMNDFVVVESLVRALKQTQFGFNHSRCPVCAGWNTTEAFSEADHCHSTECPVARAIELGESFLQSYVEERTVAVSEGKRN